MAAKQNTVKKKNLNSFSLVRYAIKGIAEKKGNDIVYINFKKNSNAPCDYFVICEGNSRTQVQAIAESVEEFIEKKTGKRPWHIEGFQNAEWVLMDYVDVVIHIFQPHSREYYGLEEMWADAEIKKIKQNSTMVKISRC
jgi:ribosome-associated protein